MKKNILICTFLLMLLGCDDGPHFSGSCLVYYNNIDKMPEQKITVTLTGRNTTKLITLKPDSNRIILELETGDFYYLNISGIRKDSVHNVIVNRPRLNSNEVEDFTFMFNEDNYSDENDKVEVEL